MSVARRLPESVPSPSKIKILAVVHKATEDHLDSINNVFSATFPGAKLLVIDVHTNSVPDDKFDLRFAFGEKAKTLGKGVFNDVFAAVSKLAKDTGDATTRVNTFNALKGHAATTAIPFEVTKLDLAAFTPDSLDRIKKALLERGTAYEGTTATGKSIRISESVEKKTADISLTIDEVFTIKFLMDVMGVNSLTLTPKTTNDK